MSCCIAAGALESSDLLLSYPTITISLHNTIILIITPKSFYIYNYNYNAGSKWEWIKDLVGIVKNIAGLKKLSAERPSTASIGNWGILQVNLDRGNYRGGLYLFIVVISFIIVWCTGKL